MNVYNVVTLSWFIQMELKILIKFLDKMQIAYKQKFNYKNCRASVMIHFTNKLFMTGLL